MILGAHHHARDPVMVYAQTGAHFHATRVHRDQIYMMIIHHQAISQSIFKEVNVYGDL